MGFLDSAAKSFSNFPIIIFYDVGPFRRNRFGMCWTHLVRERGVFFIGCFCGGSNGCCRLAASLEKNLRVDQSLPFGSLQY